MPDTTPSAAGHSTPGLGWVYACLGRPRSTLCLSLATIVLLTLGALQLTVTTDLRVYFSADNPQLGALDELEDKYRENDSLMFLVLPRQGSIYRQRILTPMES